MGRNGISHPILQPGEADSGRFLADIADHLTPKYVGFTWWRSVCNGHVAAAKRLSVDRAMWGDYSQAAQRVEGWSLGPDLIRSERAPGRVVYMRFIRDRDGEDSVQRFIDAPVDEVLFLTLVMCDDGTWGVWSLGGMPSEDSIVT